MVVAKRVDQPLRDWDCALDLGGDGVAPGDLAAAVSTGASLSGWLGQKQKSQETLGRASRTAFGHRFMAFIHRTNHPGKTGFSHAEQLMREAPLKKTHP